MRLTSKKPASEEQEQMAAVKWLELKRIPVFHIPNGGKRNLIEAVKFKQLGVRSGIPDLFIPVAKGKYHGLFIEIKRSKDAYLSDNQQFWLSVLEKQGYAVFVGYGADQVIRFVTKYMELDNDEGKPNPTASRSENYNTSATALVREQIKGYSR